MKLLARAVCPILIHLRAFISKEGPRGGHPTMARCLWMTGAQLERLDRSGGLELRGSTPMQKACPFSPRPSVRAVLRTQSSHFPTRTAEQDAAQYLSVLSPNDPPQSWKIISFESTRIENSQKKRNNRWETVSFSALVFRWCPNMHLAPTSGTHMYVRLNEIQIPGRGPVLPRVVWREYTSIL
jgi:hypothetical protein